MHKGTFFAIFFWGCPGPAHPLNPCPRRALVAMLRGSLRISASVLGKVSSGSPFPGLRRLRSALRPHQSPAIGGDSVFLPAVVTPAQRSPNFAVRHSLFAICYSLFAICNSLLAIRILHFAFHCSLLTAHRSMLTSQYS
jgi:hypothetical protein